METKRIIAKTKMKEIPKTCRECDLHVFGNGMILCGVCRDWLTPQEYNEGKIRLENCPLEEVNATN